MSKEMGLRVEVEWTVEVVTDRLEILVNPGVV